MNHSDSQEEQAQPPSCGGDSGKYFFPDRRTLEDSFAGNVQSNMKAAETAFQLSLSLRDVRIHAQSPDPAKVDRAISFLTGLQRIQEYREGPLSQNEFDRVLRSYQQGSEGDLKDYFAERIHVSPRKKDILARTANQLEYIRAMRKSDLVFGLGPAGTGKTYLAMAMAVSELLARNFSRIILTRPAVEAGENLGFLPGTLQDKIDPYLRPLHDALFDMLDAQEAESLRSRGIIEVAPLAFMRGRTLNHSFIILDEAQNATSEQMMMFLTRLGFRSRCIVCGDPSQTDLPGRRESGLIRAERALKDIEEIRFCRFTADDVVRHPLVEKIVRAYDRDSNRLGDPSYANH